MSGNTQLAVGMFEIAQKRMLGTYPFHTHLLARWQIEPTRAIPTMGVTVCGSATRLLYNPDFVVSCSFDELAGVVHHEINHLLFEHLFMEPKDFPDEEALVIAQETSANEWIPESLPGVPILLAQFPGLPANEDAATRYRRLARDAQRGHDRGWKSAQTGRKSVSTVPNFPVPARNPAQDGRVSRMPLDDHSVWDQARASGPIGRMGIRVLVREAGQILTADDWKKINPVLRSRIQQLAGADFPGSGCEVLDGRRDGRRDWRRVLRRYVRLATEERPAFKRPPRRFPDLVGILPGWRRHSGPPSVMVIIDTSASMGTEVLEAVAGELVRLAAAHRLVVVECDTAVRAVYPFRGNIKKVYGRGGTDLRPPFDQTLLTKVRPDVIICFTDGCGPAPDRPPRVPVIWCLSPGGHKPAAWGREITLSVVDEDGDRREPYAGQRLTTHQLSPYIRLPGSSRSAREAAT